METGHFVDTNGWNRHKLHELSANVDVYEISLHRTLVEIREIRVSNRA
jgi:hypothetical protein